MERAPINGIRQVSLMVEIKRKRTFRRHLLSTLFLIAAAFLIGSAFVVTDYKERFPKWQFVDIWLDSKSAACKGDYRPNGAESLPKGIAAITSDLEMRPLWGSHKKSSKSVTNLLAMAVGIKQKQNVNKIVKNFIRSNDFVVMLFHYDGNVDQWRDLDWCDHAIHVSAVNQTKWWFAKRFLHPDIVFEYSYIFLWDEDLGVEHFNVQNYLSIIKEEGLEISQPALDPEASEVHHDLTERDRNLIVHRKIHKTLRGGRKCDENSRGPPCTGFVEMMAPVFSKASWRCVWHMIQNDLIHAWGLDFQLGYCSQGDRTKNIGIVDSEYLLHYGIPTLGGSTADKKKTPSNQTDARSEVRKQSYAELEMFKNRWKKAVREDSCWTDPFESPTQSTNYTDVLNPFFSLNISSHLTLQSSYIVDIKESLQLYWQAMQILFLVQIVNHKVPS